MQLPVLAVCDREEIYVYRMLEFLNFKKTFPFQMQAFTSALSLKEFVKKKRIEVLLVSEGLFEPYMEKYANYTILLSEKGNLQHDKTEKIEAMESIYKYQSVDMIMKQVLKICNREEPLKESILGEQGPKIIGIYSPVKRCLQTSFTILYGQILSKKHQVLYINFETYSGFASCYKGEKIPDLTDLMYFLNHSKEKFMLKLAGMIQNVNGLDMVPPVLSFLDLASIPGEQWEILLGEIGKRCEYEYILLDLSDYIQGLFDILRLCTKVYTITRNDGMAIAKVEQYEKLLQALEYPDVMNKTVKCHFPQFQNIPSSIENIKDSIDYALVFNPEYYSTAHADLKAAYGTNVTLLFSHFCNYGMREGCQASTTFNVQKYRSLYADLQAAFDTDLKKYYQHYITNGHNEGRTAI